MKRMNEVFELPVDHKKLEMYGAGELQGVPYHVVEERAAHAINNVDALDCALFDCIELIEQIGLKSSDAYQAATSALNAYRGSK